MERYSVDAVAHDPSNRDDAGDVYKVEEASFEEFNVEAPNLEVATQMAALRAFQGWERLRISRRLPKGGVWLKIVVELTEGRKT